MEKSVQRDLASSTNNFLHARSAPSSFGQACLFTNVCVLTAETRTRSGYGFLRLFRQPRTPLMFPLLAQIKIKYKSPFQGGPADQQTYAQRISVFGVRRIDVAEHYFWPLLPFFILQELASLPDLRPLLLSTAQAQGEARHIAETTRYPRITSRVTTHVRGAFDYITRSLSEQREHSNDPCATRTRRATQQSQAA